MKIARVENFPHPSDDIHMENHLMLLLSIVLQTYTHTYVLYQEWKYLQKTHVCDGSLLDSYFRIGLISFNQLTERGRVGETVSDVSHAAENSIRKHSVRKPRDEGDEKEAQE